MRKTAAIILSAAAIVVFSSDAEARRLRLSFGKSSAPTPAAPVAKPAAAASAASNTQARGGTFVYVSTNRNNQPRPMAAAPQGPIPERGPLHEIAAAMDQMPPAEKPAEQPVEQKPEAPTVRVTPVFISQAAPVAKPVERPAERIASAQPTKMVYCVKQANGACAPF